MNQIILPSPHCYRLKHRIDSRPRVNEPGRYDYCVHCTLGYAQAFATSGGNAMFADDFVQHLRNERTPVT